VSKRRQNRVLAGLFLLSFFIVFTSGCDKYTKHKVLTFFFTGVPSLEEKEKEVTEAKKPERRIIPEAQYFMHGPYAAEQCYHCHVLSPTFSRFRGKGGISSLGEQSPGLLVAPVKELCVKCHLVPKHGFARPAHWADKPPVSDSNCTFCHDSHQSPFQYMLRKEF
jgi:hypothetical protein